MDNPRDATFELEAGDLVYAQRLYFWETLRGARALARLFFIWICTVFILWMVLNAWGEVVDNAMGVAIVAMVVGSLFVAMPGLVVYTAGWRTARKTLTQQKTLQKPLHVSWDDENISLKNDFGESRFKWTDIFKIRQDDRIILLYESERIYRLIPKRILTEAQRVDLSSIVAKISADA